MKYKIGDKVKIVKGGYYFRKPESWSWLGIYKELTSEKSGLLNSGNIYKIKAVKENIFGYNWYLFEGYLNWFTEEGLELVKKDNLPFEIGTLLNYHGNKVSFVGKNGNNLIAEVVNLEGGGWLNNGQVPKDYQARYTNKYFYICGDESLWEEPMSVDEVSPLLKEEEVKSESEENIYWPIHFTSRYKDITYKFDGDKFSELIKSVFDSKHEDTNLQKPVNINKKKKSKILVHF